VVAVGVTEADAAAGQSKFDEAARVVLVVVDADLVAARTLEVEVVVLAAAMQADAAAAQ
jgi:hypothetical protein